VTATWLAAGDQGGGGSALGRIVLVAVAVLAVGAFAILQVKARSRRRRRRPLDQRYGYPPGYEPYPRYDPDRSPWAVRDEGRSLITAFLSSTLRV
jgi:hypothetical protein